jgi:hypothetical protein
MGVALAALVVAVSGGAYAATRGHSDETIGACVRHKGGALYVARRCAHRDKRLTWSIQGPRGAAGARGAAGKDGTAGPPGPSGPTVLAQPAAWVLHSAAPQSDSVSPDPAESDGSADAEEDAFKFGGFGGPFTATGQMQQFLLSPSILSGTAVRLTSVSFCYFVGPYPPGNTLTSTVINHIWVYELNEADTGAGFPPSKVSTPLDQAVSLGNKSHGCPTYSLTSPPPIEPGSFLFLRVRVVDTQGNGDSNGALAQLGRVTASYGP